MSDWIQLVSSLHLVGCEFFIHIIFLLLGSEPHVIVHLLPIINQRNSVNIIIIIIIIAGLNSVPQTPM